LVMAFQNEQNARDMREALATRLAQFGLELHSDKTRVLRFGRHALENAKSDGHTRPETFDFLGFTHIAGKSRRGELPAATPYLKEETEDRAGSATRNDEAQPTHASESTIQVAYTRTGGALSVLRSAHEPSIASAVSRTGGSDVASPASTAE